MAATKNKTSNDELKNVSGDSGVATVGENERLEHTEGGTTTRDDILDLGVPMLPGSPDERQGPEDALGVGPKRGDYTNRIGPSSYHPHETRPLTREESRNREPGSPNVKIEAQRPRAEDIGDASGLKGGVETSTTEGAPLTDKGHK